MSQDLRLYSLSLLIVLMLWTTPGRADYGTGSGCPTLAVPVLLADGDVWHDGAGDDFRNLFPDTGTNAYVASLPTGSDISTCALYVGHGKYYDGANHLWTLDSDLTNCQFIYGDTGDFRTGDEY